MKTVLEIEKEIALKRKLIEGFNVCIADNEKAIKAATVNKENLLKEITTLEWVLAPSEQTIKAMPKPKQPSIMDENENIDGCGISQASTKI